MAQIPLKSIKFPGLPDTYTIDGGLSEEAKAALLACFQHVAWIDEHGQNYYDALERALFFDSSYPQIIAVYNPGTHDAHAGDSLETLRPYIVVKYYASQESSGEVVTGYTMTGSLTSGNNTIAINYNSLLAYITVYIEEETTEEIIIGQSSPFETGIPLWYTHPGETNPRYTIEKTTNNRVGANISILQFFAGDKITLPDYGTYKYAIGTDVAESSAHNQMWINGGYQFADYTLLLEDIADMKCFMVARIDNADFTQSDINYLNSNVKIIRG